MCDISIQGCHTGPASPWWVSSTCAMDAPAHSPCWLCAWPGIPVTDRSAACTSASADDRE